VGVARWAHLAHSGLASRAAEEAPVNDAERKRNARIAALDDRTLLRLLLQDFGDDVSSEERDAFDGMLRTTVRSSMSLVPLTQKQRAWAEEVARRVVPFDSNEVPRGKEVATPAVLKNLPKRPPGGRT
jgi:hypothetical protein